MIHKSEIPILEFDSDPNAVIMPARKNLQLNLPEKAVFAFLGSYIDEYAQAHGAEKVGEFKSSTKNYPIYILNHRGQEICLVQAPVGASAATEILDWLIGYGVKKTISGGRCGVLTDIKENSFLVPYKALRDEGTSYHYMPPSRYVYINQSAIHAIENAIAKHGLNCRKVVTWSTDGFYRETKEKVDYRRQEGCEAVEMECSALAACAELRNTIWGCLLFTADTLADTENYDERNWGRDSDALALEICMDAVLKL